MVDDIAKVNFGLRQISDSGILCIVQISIPIFLQPFLDWPIDDFLNVVDNFLEQRCAILGVADDLIKWLDCPQEIKSVWPYLVDMRRTHALICASELTASLLHSIVVDYDVVVFEVLSRLYNVQVTKSLYFDTRHQSSLNIYDDCLLALQRIYPSQVGLIFCKPRHF